MDNDLKSLDNISIKHEKMLENLLDFFEKTWRGIEPDDIFFQRVESFKSEFRKAEPLFRDIMEKQRGVNVNIKDSECEFIIVSNNVNVDEVKKSISDFVKNTIKLIYH